MENTIKPTTFEKKKCNKVSEWKVFLSAEDKIVQLRFMLNLHGLETSFVTEFIY